jgi:undecaprenyl-phosphate 4-deoxy-4-formamido-L-arabinose transferase
MSTPQLSVVIPVYNEEDGLQTLFDRLYPALDKLAISYEILFINDGSRDRSAAILREQFQQRPDVTRVILFNGNFGQHMAIMAGFEQSRGQRIVTLDADLQNPPEEIGKLLAKMDEGYDYIGSIRMQRNDSWWRHAASRAMNSLRERITHIKITDQGCMLRAYDRGIIDAINSCKEVNTGFSVVPLQWFSMFGMLISAFSALLFVVLVIRRLMIGPEAEGLFTLFALVFFMIGISLFGIGLLGEYIGRIYQQVRQRPRYLVEAVLESDEK